METSGEFITAVGLPNDGPASGSKDDDKCGRQPPSNCIFLSFSAPHHTCLELACPTIPVFAWEFSSMPDEAWWEDRPEHDWGWCLQQCAGAIVHSQQSAECVRTMMGPDYPVVASCSWAAWSLPACSTLGMAARTG